MRSIHTFFVRPCEAKHQLIILIAAFAMVQYSVPIAPTEHTAAPGGEGHTNTSGVATEDVFLAPTCSLLCDPAAITATLDVDIKPGPELSVQPRPQHDAVAQDGELSLFPSPLQLLVCILVGCVIRQNRVLKSLESERTRRPDPETVQLSNLVECEDHLRRCTAQQQHDEWVVIVEMCVMGRRLVDAKADAVSAMGQQSSLQAAEEHAADMAQRVLADQHAIGRLNIAHEAEVSWLAAAHEKALQFVRTGAAEQLTAALAAERATHDESIREQAEASRVSAEAKLRQQEKKFRDEKADVEARYLHEITVMQDQVALHQRTIDDLRAVVEAKTRECDERAQTDMAKSERDRIVQSQRTLIEQLIDQNTLIDAELAEARQKIGRLEEAHGKMIEPSGDK